MFHLTMVGISYPSVDITTMVDRMLFLLTILSTTAIFRVEFSALSCGVMSLLSVVFHDNPRPGISVKLALTVDQCVVAQFDILEQCGTSLCY